MPNKLNLVWSPKFLIVLNSNVFEEFLFGISFFSQLLIQRLPNFDILRKGAGNIFSPNFLYEFSRQILLMLYSVNWPNLIVTFWHGCSPVNLLHIFGTPFLKNTAGWLLLNFVCMSTFYCGYQRYRWICLAIRSLLLRVTSHVISRSSPRRSSI